MYQKLNCVLDQVIKIHMVLNVLRRVMLHLLNVTNT